MNNISRFMLLLGIFLKAMKLKKIKEKIGHQFTGLPYYLSI